MASRLLVQESVADEYLNLLKQEFEAGSKRGILGNPMDKKTEIGPVADKIQLDRVLGYLDIGKKDSQLVLGGVRHGDKGCFVEPTVFSNPSKGSRIVEEEVFGPVITVQTFKTEEEAVELANDTVFGLSGMASHIPLTPLLPL